MFAALTLEQDPLTLKDLPAAFVSWIQDVGGFAAFFLAIWLVFYLISRRSPYAATAAASAVRVGLIAYIWWPLLLIFWYLGRTRATPPEIRVPGTVGPPRSQLTVALFAGLTAWAVLAYFMLGALYVPDLLHRVFSDGTTVRVHTPFRVILEQVLLTTGGICAVLAVLVPIIADLARLSPRRIWALAKLTIKEAIRGKILWAFALVLLALLFAGWFLDYKPEHQVLTYVTFVTWIMTLLLLITAGLLASFSLPADIRNQTIHTVLTKPVERFEVVLGRFLGCTILMTLVLLAATGISLLYVLRGVNPAAAAQSLKAREPLFGTLSFEGTPDPRKGESVGREWEYRGYISGPLPPNPTQYAVWKFESLPRRLADRKNVRCEFTFDIFRTTKGRDYERITCDFEFETWRFREGNKEEYRRERKKLHDESNSDQHAAIDEQLVEKYGYYEAKGVDFKDYHTRSIDIPATLIKNALADDPERRQELRSAGQQEYVPLRVKVSCTSRTQYVGMAKYDYYFRVDDHESKADMVWFSWNFFKGSAGLWFRLCIVIGLATTLSTYLSGVITLLFTAFLFIMGFFQEYIRELGFGRNVGGGPMESMLRLFKGQNLVAELEPTAAAQMAMRSDVVFRWCLRRFLDILPDVDRFGLTDYVAEGFNISGGQLFVNLILLLGYLLPWAVLAYYMLRSREIAGAT